MSWREWAGTDDARFEALKAQAAQDLNRLGHGQGRPVTGWYNMGRRRWMARCLACGDEAYINVRTPGTQSVSGPAAVFRCSGRYLDA